ncbi:MAG: aminopeptidase N, partial [Actinobacteria bacterium]|nr:aminopeptidase N [Actinomycetota bacterium]
MQSQTSPEALFRTEARERARLISDTTYTVKLDLTRGDELFGSTSLITFACSEPGASTFLDLTAPSVDSIELNGKALDPDAFSGHRITLDGLQAQNTLRVVASCAYSHSGTGLHFFRDPVDKQPYLHSQFEAREAHKVFGCFDQPDLKATFEITVTADPDWVVVSNTPGEKTGNTTRFPRTKTMSTYLVAVVAGPYYEVRKQHGDIDLGIFCRQSLKQYLDPDEIFEVTTQGFDFFRSFFDYPYVWGKYDQLFVPEFNAGAMENCGAVTFNESMVFRSKVTDAAREGRASVILHEMAHMWFGDLVTMDWWDDLWLNESFATYMATFSQARATRWTNAWVRFAQAQKLNAMVQDQMPTTHPIVADVPDTESARTNFDGISYAKGASVLKQLGAWVGEEEFRDGVRQYLKDYEFKNASLTDFLAALEKASGRDLTAWAKEWLETAGVNTFRARFEESGNAYARFALDQSAIQEQPTLRSHRIALGLYDLANGSLVRRKQIHLDASGATTDVPDLPGEPVPDLLLINDDDLSYCKIRLDERSLRTVTEHLATLPDPLARALIWTAATDQLRDAELAARDYVRLVLNNVHVEDDPGTVGNLLAQATNAFTLYGDPANRDALRLQLATRALEELRRCEAGSDLQLVWARQLIGAARSDEHVAIVRGLLDGDNPFDGLKIDTDLRWAIVNALSSIGKLDEKSIADELERDPTDQG